jgi:uncharacterized protein YyaL (SSP411 family)
MSHKANNLIKESSPYLLQHAYNPVDWHAWNEETLAKARRERKPLIISIGYSTCHWCHVMERECFEDQDVADVMNEYFIPIKVDREEHPDVDAHYMNALQKMTGSGGWPLNIVALPDSRPVWGTTYLPPNRWKKALKELSDIIINEPNKVEGVATNLENSIDSSRALKVMEAKDLNLDQLYNSVNGLKSHFDYTWGGLNRAPKFPQPNNYRFLLHLNELQKDSDLETFILTTVEKISLGGIRDWVGGGFARYSVDEYWKVPHFEKMLYDNSQLMRLYADLYKKYGDDFYKSMIYDIHRWVEKEMTTANGAFYSAMDADSEGVEGKYYVWQDNELRELLGSDFELFADYFNIEPNGNWEGNNIVHSHYRKEVYCEQNKIDIDQFDAVIEKSLKILEKARETRIPPSKDNKIITSWNALMATAYLNAYEASSDENLLKMGIDNIEFFIKAFERDLKIYHTYNENQGNIESYFEDYAFLIEALLKAFSVVSEYKYYDLAVELTEISIENYYSNFVDMFSLNSTKQSRHISKKYEYEDNVVPSSNSVMAQNLFILNSINHNALYEDMYLKMAKKMNDNVLKYPFGFSNWGILSIWENKFSEIVITGNASKEPLKYLQREFLPFTFLAASENDLELDLFHNRKVPGKTMIYKCVERNCSLPVETLDQLDLSDLITI